MKGISISAQERSRDIPLQDYPLQDFYYIPVLDTFHSEISSAVKEGQLLTSSDNLYIKYHSPISGTITNILNFNNKEYIEIERSRHTPPLEYPFSSPQGIPVDYLLQRIEQSGLPIYQNILKTKGNIRSIVINGVDTEVFITINKYLLYEKAKEIIQTAFQLKNILEAQEIIIVITKNKKLKTYLESLIVNTNIKIIEMPKRYPLSTEKLLLNYLFDIEIPKHQTAHEHKIFTIDIPTIFALYESLFHKKPYIDKFISVEGAYSLTQGNFRVKFGTPISAFMRPFSIETSYVMFSGGPITGQTIDKQKSLLKDMDAIMIFEGKPKQTETFCISCARCTQNCPINLEPIRLVDFIRHQEFNLAEENHIHECINCNICTYVCPSHIPLGQEIKDYISSNIHIHKEGTHA